jgi:uncharacterized UPF0160 family protein
MSEELTNEVVEEPAVEEAAEVEAPATEEIEKSVDGAEEPAVEEPAAEEVVEVAAEEVEQDFEKMLDGIKAYITEAIAKAADTPGVEEIISQMMSNVNKSMEDINAKQEAMSKAVTEVTAALGEIRNRMGAYEAATAMKKSNDLDTESFGTVRKTESIWKGHFLGVQNL